MYFFYFIVFLRTPEGATFKKKAILAFFLFGGTKYMYDRYNTNKLSESNKKKYDALSNKDKEVLANSKPRVAVNAIFFQRLIKILKIVVPTVYSTEMVYLIILTGLLVARTMFSVVIAELVGKYTKNT